MKNYLYTVLAILSLVFVPYTVASELHGAKLGGAKLGGSVGGCSGETPQSFEQATDGSFDTHTGFLWTVDDDAGVIDTASNTQSHCGSKSLAITCNSATATDEWVQIDMGAVDNDFHSRFVIRVPPILDWKQLRPIYFDGESGAPPGGNKAYLRLYDDSTGGSTISVHISADGASARDFNITEDNSWFLFQIHYDDDGNVTVKCWKWSGAAWEIQYNDQGTPNTDITAAGFGTGGPRYVKISDYYNDTTAVVFYVDDVDFSLSGGDYIGEPSCCAGP